MIRESGISNLQVTFTKLTMLNSNKKYILGVTPINHHDNVINESVKPIYSSGIFCIQFRLSINILENSSFEKEEGIWYKDESGKEKSIDMHVQLLDCFGDLVTSRYLPLKSTLLYGESGQPRHIESDFTLLICKYY